MMRVMRENPVFVLGVIVFVVAAFVGTIFLVYGLQSSSGGGGLRDDTVVAVVEEEDIPYSEFRNTYNSQVDFYRQFYPGLGIREMEERFQLKKKALDSMINMRLLLGEALRMGLEVSDDELSRKISETPLFQENGRFDSSKYRQILAASRVTAAAYEENQRQEMLVEKVRDIIQDAVGVTEAEIRKAFRRERDKVRLKLLPLSVETYRGWVSATAEEVRSHFDEDPGKFRRPERIRVSYIAIESASLEGTVDPGDEDLIEYYDSNAGQYQTPKQVRGRHILISADLDVSAEKENELRERAEFVLSKAREGADFAELAKEFSQDTSGPEGGDLGWFGAGQMVPAFEEAAFSLAAGQLSEVVRTEFGFHVIKVEEIKEAGLRPFEEVREEVAKAYKNEKARDLAGDMSEKVADDLYDGEFGEVAGRYGLEVRTAERLTKDDLLPGLGYRPDVSEALFELGEGAISEPYRQGRDYYIFAVEEKKASFVPDFSEAESEARQNLVDLRSGEKARLEARSMLGKLKSGSELGSVAEMVKAEIKETTLFGRSDFVTEAGTDGEAFAGAFGLAEGDFGGPVSSGDTVWIYRVLEVKSASEEEFSGAKEDIAERLTKEKQEMLFESWLEDLRRVRSVEIDEALLGT